LASIGADQISQFLSRELSEPDLTKPVHPYALEISDYFLESTNLGPWTTYSRSVLENHSTLSQTQSTTQNDSQSTAAEPTATISGQQINNAKVAKLALGTRKKVQDIFKSWVNHRRAKLVNLMGIEGGTFHPMTQLNKGCPAEVLGSLYLREFRWLNPMGIDTILKLKLGARPPRNVHSPLVLGSLGLDYEAFDTQAMKIDKQFCEIFNDNYAKIMSVCSRDSSLKIIDWIHERALENQEN